MSNNQGTPEFTIEGLLDDLNLALDENKELCAEVERLEKERDIYKACLEHFMYDHTVVDKATVLLKTREALIKGKEIASLNNKEKE